MSRPSLLTRLCVLVAATLVLAACGTDDDAGNGSTAQPDTEQPPADGEDEVADAPADGPAIAVTSFIFF